MSSSPSVLRYVLSLVMLRHPRARERDGGVRCHVRSGDDRDRNRDRPKVTVGRTAESGVGAWVSLEAALTKNCHCHGNVETVVARRMSPPRPMSPSGSQSPGHFTPPSSVIRCLAPRPRLAMSDFFWCGFNSGSRWNLPKKSLYKWKPHRPRHLKYKIHGFRTKMRIEQQQQTQKTAAPKGICC